MTDVPGDDKDWTWVLERPCPDCGFAAAEIDGPAIADRIPALLDPWQDVLDRPDATDRPRPDVWSAVEYACHVRDVCLLFTERVEQMLAQDGPGFANWDQDEAAVSGRYAQQDPREVAAQILQAGARVEDAFATVPGDAWGRRGLRSDGTPFTVETLGQYLLHELAHHLVDVRA